jgi:hypothetical protein
MVGPGKKYLALTWRTLVDLTIILILAGMKAEKGIRKYSALDMANFEHEPLYMRFI